MWIFAFSLFFTRMRGLASRLVRPSVCLSDRRNSGSVKVRRTRFWSRERNSGRVRVRSEEHTSELQSQSNLVCRLLLEKKKEKTINMTELYLYSTYYCVSLFFFFFNDTATTEIYTLSLHDALPICSSRGCGDWRAGWSGRRSA